MLDHQSSSLRAARIGVFGGIFAVLSLIPLSPFIGGASLLTLNLIVTPTISIILSPVEALLAALIGSLIGIYIAPQSAMFGPFTILMPIIGASLGSLAYHKPKLAPLISIYLSATIFIFLMNVPFIYWTIPHVTALILVSFAWFYRGKNPIRVVFHTFVTTMIEQGTMMILAAYFLLKVYGLQWWTVFPPALPLMVLERSVGTIGGALLSIALMKTIPKHYLSI